MSKNTVILAGGLGAGYLAYRYVRDDPVKLLDLDTLKFLAKQGASEQWWTMVARTQVIDNELLLLSQSKIHWTDLKMNPHVNLNMILSWSKTIPVYDLVGLLEQAETLDWNKVKNYLSLYNSMNTIVSLLCQTQNWRVVEQICSMTSKAQVECSEQPLWSDPCGMFELYEYLSWEPIYDNCHWNEIREYKCNWFVKAGKYLVGKYTNMRPWKWTNGELFKHWLFMKPPDQINWYEVSHWPGILVDCPDEYVEYLDWEILSRCLKVLVYCPRKWYGKLDWNVVMDHLAHTKSHNISEAIEEYVGQLDWDELLSGWDIHTIEQLYQLFPCCRIHIMENLILERKMEMSFNFQLEHGWVSFDRISSDGLNERNYMMCVKGYQERCLDGILKLPIYLVREIESFLEDNVKVQNHALERIKTDAVILEILKNGWTSEVQVLEHCRLNSGFIRKYWRKFDWDQLCRWQVIPKEVIQEAMKSGKSLRELAKYQKLDNEIITERIDELMPDLKHNWLYKSEDEKVELILAKYPDLVFAGNRVRLTKVTDSHCRRCNYMETEDGSGQQLINGPNNHYCVNLDGLVMTTDGKFRC